MQSVLVVASDPERAQIVNILETAGLLILEAGDGPSGVREILNGSPDGIVMTEEVPPVNGLDYLPFVRGLTSVPILVVGRGGERRVSHALFQGADAYVTRPIDGSPFVARLNSLVRRERSSTPRGC